MWLQEHYPHPEARPDSCHAGDSRRLCDPDNVLTESGRLKVEEYLQTKKYVPARIFNECLADEATTRDTKEEEASMEEMELQMAVALVKKMDLTPFGTDESLREEHAAETFARYVHDDWGVGVETESCGGAGVLLFLSILDRTVYISRGTALEATLTDRRLDRIIENMKGLLRSEYYDEAIIQALEDTRQYVARGPPTLWEKSIFVFVNQLFPFLWILTIVATVVGQLWTDRRRKRDYARVRSQLNEIDRARAEALAGKYLAKSCPICLEDFEVPPTEGGGVPTKGSDGQPIKLLRCGHCMDESCWAEWINSGRGTITKCPICQQDIGGADDNNNSSNDNNAQQQRQRQQGAPVRRRDPDRNNNNHHPQDEAAGRDVLDNFNNNDDDRMLRQYRRERNFRLARLGYRYPQIIRPGQIQRWSQSTYDGSLVRDPSFVQSNPANARPTPRSGGGMRSGGFGGSSSGGGRAGRW